MNQITDPDPLTRRQAENKFKKLAPIVLIVDLILAVVIWIMSDQIFDQESGYLGRLLAGGLVIAGLFSYFILKMMGKKLEMLEKTRSEVKEEKK